MRRLSPILVAIALVSCSAALLWSGVACSGAPAVEDAGPSKPDGGAPYLTSLSVKSTESPSITLIPPFDPATYDYYVRCAAGTNRLSVSMTAADKAEGQIVQPTPASPSSSMQTLSVSVDEGKAIVAQATLKGD